MLGATLTLTPGAALPAGAETADLAGEVASEALTDIVVAIAGIDRDGIGELIKGSGSCPPTRRCPRACRSTCASFCTSRPRPAAEDGRS